MIGTRTSSLQIKAILKKYYRQATLESDFARRVFVLPDVLDLAE